MICSKNDMQNISEFTLQKFKFALEGRISQEMAQDCPMEVYVDYMAKDIVYKLTRDVLGEKLDTIKYPENWKEAVKEAFFNWIKSAKIRSFLSERHPVKYKTYNAMMYYPKMAIPEQEHEFRFARWND